MQKLLISLSALLLGASSLANAQQDDCKAAVVKHLTTSRDFTVKVAEAMPEADYDFKLTAEQMSFGQQMTHLSSGFTYFLSVFSGEKPSETKPVSTKKADIVAFVKSSYDAALAKVTQLTPEQMTKTYKSEEGTRTGTDLLLGMLDHATHHRASAEMYLRAKGIKPPEYEF